MFTLHGCGAPRVSSWIEEVLSLRLHASRVSSKICWVGKLVQGIVIAGTSLFYANNIFCRNDALGPLLSLRRSQTLTRSTPQNSVNLLGPVKLW